jgi:hypothetical protein
MIEHRADASQSMAIGARICAFAGLGWAFGGSGGLPSSAVAPVLVVALVLTLVLARRARALNTVPEPWPDSVSGSYRRIVASEVAAILVVVIAGSAAGLTTFVAPAVALVVGLHFLPLASTFSVPAYRITAVGVCGAGLAGVAIATRSGPTALAATGLGAAMTLWLTAAHAVRPPRRRW